MVDLSKLSKQARVAAMRGGTDGWGQLGSSADDVRYAEPVVDPRSRRLCTCGCKRRSTHKGMANGVCLTSGCELSMARWVKTGQTVRLVPVPEVDET